MAEIDSDTNFAFLIMILAIVLMSLIAGTKINEIVMHRNGVLSEAIWQFVFIIAAMAILSSAILAPYLAYELGHFSVLLGGVKLGVMLWYYSYHAQFFFSTGEGTVMGEAMSAILIAASGAILLRTTKKETIADKLKKG